MKNIFTIVPQFLKDPESFYQSVLANQNLKAKAAGLFLSSLVFLMVYGLMTGLSHSWQQGISTALKMPVLFLATLAITLPALYFFSLAFLNVRFSVAQAGIVVLTGIGVSAFLLLGLAPVTAFFVFTSTNYAFFQLLAVFFVAISGMTGLFYILKGFRQVDRDGELSRNTVGNLLMKAWVIDQQHLMVLVVTPVAAPLDGPQLGEFLLPVTQHVGLHAAQLADFAYREITLGGNRRQLGRRRGFTLQHHSAAPHWPSASGWRGRSPRAGL